jgi:hypothetical protein
VPSAASLVGVGGHRFVVPRGPLATIRPETHLSLPTTPFEQSRPATVPVVLTLVRRIFLVIASQAGRRWEWWRKGIRCNPLRHRGPHAFLQVGSRSVYGDAGTGRFACDLRDGASDADVNEAGRPEFEVEGTAVGFAIGCNRIFFVNGKDV